MLYIYKGGHAKTNTRVVKIVERENNSDGVRTQHIQRDGGLSHP